MNQNALVPYPGQLVMQRGKHGRKVFIVLGPSRNPLKVRARAWCESGLRWQGVTLLVIDNLNHAPTFWRQTIKAAKAAHEVQLDVTRKGATP